MVKEKKDEGVKTVLLQVLIGFLILIGVGVFIFLMFSNTKKESVITLTDNELVIEGQYARTYDLNDLVSVEKSDSIPTVKSKLNGAGVGEIKKGLFDVETFGETYMYVHKTAGPYIIIMTTEKPLIINFYEDEDTEALYNQLDEKINN